MVDGEVRLGRASATPRSSCARAASKGRCRRDHCSSARCNAGRPRFDRRRRWTPARAAPATAVRRSLSAPPRPGPPARRRRAASTRRPQVASAKRSSAAPAVSDAHRAGGIAVRGAAGRAASPRARAARPRTRDSMSASRPSRPRTAGLGLLKATLAHPQSGQAGERPGMEGRAGALGDAQPGVQLPLRVGPPTLGDEHAPVVDAALGVEERAAVGFHEVVRHLAPLRCPLGIAGQLAGVEHVAAGIDRGVEVRRLAGQDGRHRFVDQREPGRGVALAHPDEPELADRRELEVEVACRPGDLNRSSAAPRPCPGPPCGRRGRPGPSREVAGARAARGAGPHGRPTVGRGVVGEVGLVRHAQPDGALGRSVYGSSPPSGPCVRSEIFIRCAAHQVAPSHRSGPTPARGGTTAEALQAQARACSNAVQAVTQRPEARTARRCRYHPRSIGPFCRQPVSDRTPGSAARPDSTSSVGITAACRVSLNVRGRRRQLTHGQGASRPAPTRPCSEGSTIERITLVQRRVAHVVMAFAGLFRRDRHQRRHGRSMPWRQGEGATG